MSVFDEAINLYIEKKIKSRPAEDFNKVVNKKLRLFTDLCMKNGFHGDRVFTLVDKVLLPWAVEVIKELENKNE